MAKAHGLRGEVVVSLVSDYPELRLAPGSHLRAGDRELVVEASAPAPGSLAGRSSKASSTAPRPRAWPGGRSRPSRSTIPRRCGSTSWSGRSCVEAGSGTERGRVVAVVANPAHDLLELDSGALVPVVFVRSCEDGVTVVDAPDGLFDPPG